MKKIVLCAVYLLFAVFCAGGAASAEPKEPRVIREIKFDREIKNSSDSRVVVTDKEMIFLDANGNVSKKKVLPRYTEVHFSKDGSRMGQRTGHDMGEKGAGRLEFKMLDENGDELWQTDSVNESVYHVSQANGGTVIGEQCEEGGCGTVITIHDKQNPKGKAIVTGIKEGAGHDGVVMSEDGNYFVDRWNLHHPDRSAIALYDISGNLLWMKHFDGERVGHIAISPNGSYIIAIIENGEKNEYALHVYDKAGELLLSQPVSRGFYQVAFDDNGRFVVAVTFGGKFYFFDVEAKKLLWKYSVEERGIKDSWFKDLDFSAGFIAVSAMDEHKSGVQPNNLPRYLYLFDINGNLLLKKKFTDHGFYSSADAPKVKIADSGKKISVRLKNKIVELDNEFAR